MGRGKVLVVCVRVRVASRAKREAQEWLADLPWWAIPLGQVLSYLVTLSQYRHCGFEMSWYEVARRVMPQQTQTLESFHPSTLRPACGELLYRMHTMKGVLPQVLLHVTYALETGGEVICSTASPRLLMGECCSSSTAELRIILLVVIWRSSLARAQPSKDAGADEGSDSKRASRHKQPFHPRVPGWKNFVYMDEGHLLMVWENNSSMGISTSLQTKYAHVVLLEV